MLNDCTRRVRNKTSGAEGKGLMQKLTFDFKKDADLDSIAKKISEFFTQCPGQNPADAKLTISERGHNAITHNGWNAGQNPPMHEVARHIATSVVQYSSGKDDYFSATVEVFFPPSRPAPIR
jgi:hypothetical protein